MLDILTYKRLHLNFDRYKKQINKTMFTVPYYKTAARL